MSAALRRGAFGGSAASSSVQAGPRGLSTMFSDVGSRLQVVEGGASSGATGAPPGSQDPSPRPRGD